MKIKDSAIWQNLVNEGQLPRLEVETFVSDDTIIKLALAVISIVVVTVILLRISK